MTDDQFTQPFRGVSVLMEITFFGSERRSFQIDIGEGAAEAMRTLPRDREISFMPESQRRACDMVARRRHLARCIAESMTEKLLKAVESRDTQNGYSPEEMTEEANP